MTRSPLRFAPALFALTLLAAPVVAHAALPSQDETEGETVWTDAPVSALGDPTVQPSSRAGGPAMQSADAGPADANPFSSYSSGTLNYGDQVDTHSAEEAQGGYIAAPNMSR